MKIRLAFIWIFALVMLPSCSDDEHTNGVEGNVSSYKIAIVMPGTDQTRWERTVDWALANITKAQQGLTSRVKLEVEWHDENDEDLENYLNGVNTDESYVALVGPMASANAYKAAVAMGKTKHETDPKKTVVLPVATSTELQRIFAGTDYVWNLTQSDIAQCEIMLTQAKLYNYSTVTLLTSDDYYGKSFSDWFAYQATELGLQVKGAIVYRNDEELRQGVTNVSGSPLSYREMLLFAPSKARDAVVFDEQLTKLKAKNISFSSVICSDIVNSSDIAQQLQNTYEGISPSADPTSGFINAYIDKFGMEPITGEAHLYDAVMLLAYALIAQREGEDLNQTIKLIVEGSYGGNYSWLPDDMRQSFSLLQAGAYPNLSGVTGDWIFDERNHISVLDTYYSHWTLRDGKCTTMEYLSIEGGHHTISNLQAWEVETQKLQEFNKDLEDISYGELEGNWAVVIGASDTWVNYRHQADALAMYQLLKRHGYDDEHIILIIEDNIAYDTNNIYPGVIKVRPDGENVYENVHVDYKLSDISIADLKEIMLGHKSERLPDVISPDSHDNVIVFWCGHGGYGHLMWGSYKEVRGSDICDIVTTMKAEEKFRKMMFVMDACYSGTIGAACSGIEGVLFFTAANEYEPSKADMKDPEMRVWLSNCFTRVFQETIDANSSISIRNLYYSVAQHTTGSHATIYNIENYGNAYSNYMSEYLK